MTLEEKNVITYCFNQLKKSKDLKEQHYAEVLGKMLVKQERTAKASLERASRWNKENRERYNATRRAKYWQNKAAKGSAPKKIRIVSSPLDKDGQA